MLLGAHVSISGGYLNALTEAKRLGIDAIQIFTKNQRFWQEKIISEEDSAAFRSSMKKFGVEQAFSHAIYLISLGSENDEIVQKSVVALAAELERCKALGLTHTVMHPGSSGTASTEKGIMKIGDNIKLALNATKGSSAKILLENTAGGGTSVGGKIEYLADLVDHIGSKRIGICIDTCHAFAAGYDIRTKKGTENLIQLIDKKIGLEKLLCFHLNDSKGTLGSKLDRHANIGEGLIGIDPFEFIMQNFKNVPKVIETPKENEADEINLALLRKLAAVP
jgi:deoxyribonuclease IV